jgi:S1-C subfamily serine protease
MGSGVIISPDGYIISNNHVVAGANKLEVVLSNKKSYIATLVGTDPNTDISLLKIEEKGPYLNFANSDNIEVGQWVLAVGNPLGLILQLQQVLFLQKEEESESWEAREKQLTLLKASFRPMLQLTG